MAAAALDKVSDLAIQVIYLAKGKPIRFDSPSPVISPIRQKKYV